MDMASAHSQKPSLCRAGRGVGWVALETSGCDRKLGNGLHPLVVNSLGGPC